MTDSLHNPRFIPFPMASQGGRFNVLYYDSSVSEVDILDCAICRLNATIGLSDVLKSWDNPPAYVIKHMSIGSHLLINDAMFLIDEAQKLIRKNNGQK